MEKLSDGGFLACGKATINGVVHGLVWRIAPPSGVSGIVRDRITGEPVVGVRIRAAELPQYSISDSIGRFTLSLPPGSYTIYSGGPCFTGDTLHSIEVLPNQNTLSDVTVGVAHMSMEHTTINIVAENHIGNYADLIVRNAGSGDLVYAFETEQISPASDWLSIVPASGRIVPGDSLAARVYVSADTLDEGTFDYFGRLYLHTNSCPETLRVLDVLAVILDADNSNPVASEFALYPTYPNPFNSSTRLRFAVERASRISLAAFNLNGQRVTTLLDAQPLPAGAHEVVWTPADLSSGIYFVRLDDGARSFSQRVLFIR
ncbi:MAG: carboxypeptidase regulatory-like domain-containing protein [bacterium]|nr:carboxypeptidase regulatory-like domain-containing protein [bacterium]